METAIRKGYGYVVRHREGRMQVLVFEHVDFPEAGTQVPGGTLEDGEEPLAGILREVFEESGLAGLQVERELGMLPWVNPATGRLHHRHFAQLAAPVGLPESWLHEVSSGTEDTGLLFHYYWMDIDTAVLALTADQGQALHLLRRDPR